ncbi:MAG: DsbC family protein [Pseudomonadota bacterium]
MKFLSFFAVLGLAFASTDSAAQESSATASADAQLESVRTKVKERFPRVAIENIVMSEVPGLYEIRQGANVAYVTNDGRYLLQGSVLDLETDVDITERSMSALRREILQDIDIEGIVFGPENPKYTVSVFTDIDCGFCRRMHREIDSYTNAGIAIQYFLLPHGSPNTPSWTKAEQVWCAADQQDAMTRAKNDQSLPPVADCDTGPVQEHVMTAVRAGLRGTPAIVLADGTWIKGYRPAQALLAELERGAGVASAAAAATD